MAKRRVEESYADLSQTVVDISRVSKMTKGGRSFHISVWVVVGDGNGMVGIGQGKSKETPEAVEKATERARKALFRATIWHGTIPHEMIVKYGATRLLMKPASPGTGIIASLPVRSVLEAAGYKNVLTKALAGTSAVNMLKAAAKGLQEIMDPIDVARARGKEVEQIVRRYGVAGQEE